jgi:hypothetical protein
MMAFRNDLNIAILSLLSHYTGTAILEILNNYPTNPAGRLLLLPAAAFCGTRRPHGAAIAGAVSSIHSIYAKSSNTPVSSLVITPAR